MKKRFVFMAVFCLNSFAQSQVLENGVYYLSSKFSGNCVELHEEDENIKAIQSLCKDTEAQRFSFSHQSNDVYTISHFTVAQNSKSNGAHIYNSMQSSHFKIKAEGDYFKIKALSSNKYLTAQPYTLEVIQYTGHDSDDQLWRVSKEKPNNDDESVEILFKGKIYKEIVSPFTGRTWLDRNLGANRVCLSYDDTQCYGDYYQWGRLTDGHEKGLSNISNTLATDVLNASSSFILDTVSPFDWTNLDSMGSQRSNSWMLSDGNGVCPEGFRVPTSPELSAETVSASTAVTDNITAFQNFLKWPSAGYRNYSDGQYHNKGVSSTVWTTKPVSTNSEDLYFDNSKAYMSVSSRAYGFSVRCIKE